ncbi:MAG: hypothetical protein KKB70_08850 [Proteobacteria bacterium]|nr:hypothetical protein [Pseudomonadota bacterium]MBU1612055.1 hypothetical protein [Pseudomonadota bacterium]
MSSYTQKDIPFTLKHGEILTMDDGTTVRFESNGEAKDIMLNQDFSPAITLFPDNDFMVQASGKTFKLTAKFEDALDIVEA